MLLEQHETMRQALIADTLLWDEQLDHPPKSVIKERCMTSTSSTRDSTKCYLTRSSIESRNTSPRGGTVALSYNSLLTE